MLSGAKPILAYDVRPSEVRTALLFHDSRGWRLERESTIGLPEGAGRKAARRSALSAAFREAGRPSPSVYTVLPKGSVFLRVVEAPKVGKKELREILSLRVAQEVPHYTEHTVIWDFETLPAKLGDTQLRVVLCAVRRETLAEFLADFEAAGIHPNVIDAEPLSLMRWYMARRGSGASDEAALVDVGEGNTSVSLIHGGRISHFGQAPFDLSDTGDTLNGAADRLALELQTAIESFASNGEKAPEPREIVFCGRDGLSEAFREPIRRSMGAEVSQLFDSVAPDERLRPGRQGGWQGGRHTLEGLAHRADLRGSGLINLAPRVERLSLLSMIFSRVTSVPVLVALAVILGITFFFLSGHIRQKRIEYIDQAYAEIEPYGPELDYLEATVSMMRVFDSQRFSWIEVLSELSELLPPTMEFSKLSMEKDGKMSLTGVVAAGTPFQIIENFTTALEDSAFFSAVQLGTIRPTRDGKRANFNISCTITGTAKGK